MSTGNESISTSPERQRRVEEARRWRFGLVENPWRWVHVGVAALAMVATLPGRTHGLGLFTEPIRKTFALDTEVYGWLNMGATLLGALFCLPCGWLLDRLGTRGVLTSVMVALGGVVVVMSRLEGSSSAIVLPSFFLLILLTRGLGQSALSVASLALIGRTSSQRGGWTMGVYSVLVSAGFLEAFWILGDKVKQHPNEWRAAWGGIGLAVIVAGLLAGMLVRPRLLETAPSLPSPPKRGRGERAQSSEA